MNLEEENVNYNEKITLVVMEDEQTSPKSHERTNDEVVKTIPEMVIELTLILST